MNKETNTLIPEIRFPEFVNESEWLEKNLGNICDVTNGKANAQDHVEDGKFPLFDRSAVIKATNNYIFDCEAVIIPGEGMRFVPKYYKGKFNLHQRAYALKDFTCIGQFVYFSMLHRSNLISQKAVQSTVLSLRLPILQNFPIEIPKNPKEQQKIASCLSSLDELIEAQNQKLNILKDHKNGLMQNLFPQEGETLPKYRFKEFDKDGNWMEKKLENSIDLFSGIALKSEELSDDQSGVPILRGINITEGYIRHSKDIDKYFLGDLENLNKYLVKENDIVIGMDGSKVGKNVALIKKEDKNSILIQRVARIRTNDNSDINFIYQHFISDKFRRYVDTVNTSSGIPHISAQQIKDFKIGFPPKLKEQQKIASCLYALDDLITAQGEEIEQLQLHKKGLMQGLFPKINT